MWARITTTFTKEIRKELAQVRGAKRAKNKCMNVSKRLIRALEYVFRARSESPANPSCSPHSA